MVVDLFQKSFSITDVSLVANSISNVNTGDVIRFQLYVRFVPNVFCHLTFAVLALRVPMYDNVFYLIFVSNTQNRASLSPASNGLVPPGKDPY